MNDTRPLGSIVLDGDRATLEYRRRLPYAIEVVWAAITEPSERAAWFGETTIDRREGGAITMDPIEPPAAPEAKRMTGEILVWDPPHVFEHTWTQRIVEDSVVRYELQPDGDHTILTFTHRGLSARNAEGFLPGGDAFLDRMEARLAGLQIPAWQDRYDELAPLYV